MTYDEPHYRLRKAWRASCLNCGLRRRFYFLEEARGRALQHEKHNPGHKVELEFRNRPRRLRAAGALVFALVVGLAGTSSAASGPHEELELNPNVSSSSELHQADEEKGSRLFRAMGLGIYGVSAGDALSTELALSRGCVELNPLQRNREVRLTSHVAFAAGFNWATEEVRKGGRPRLALWLRIGANVGLGYITARNLSAGRR